MKLRTPFTVFSSPIKDIDRINDLYYKLPHKKKDFSWEEECKFHSTKPTCKPYEV